MAYPNRNSLSGRSLEERINAWEMAGYGFEASGLLTLAAGTGVTKTIFKTGNKPVVLYSREVSYNGDGFDAYLYRDPTYSDDGESITDFRQSSDIATSASGVEIISGATISADGIESRSARYIFGNDSNQGNGNTLEVISTPQLILPNKTVLLVFVTRDSAQQELASHLQWCEPPKIDDLIIQNNAFVAYTGP